MGRMCRHTLTVRHWSGSRRRIPTSSSVSNRTGAEKGCKMAAAGTCMEEATIFSYE